ncbi:hypothetical protein DH2020_029456 [Rehmannia glutinosa]|uniref:Peptidase A1 domain-containing protein n=1 Tax=Rehmannia glutinosa TaxID=99300 RepID=A0ABR0VR26_REHGL
MKISVGTPPFEILGIADTGSDLTWTQCQPCTQCYKQKAHLFDPRKTKTYRNISCESQACSAIDIRSCDINNVCEYQYSYGDGSYTIGDLAVETFTFDSSTKKPVSFPKVVFGKISFGTNAIVTGPSVVSTPLVKKYPDTYYYLTIEGISVGTNQVEYQNSKESVAEGNIIIDSGTTLTYLPSDFYDGLEAALVKAVKGKRVPYSKDSLKLCYELNSDFSAPPVIAHFKGADVELTQENTFLEVEQGIVCLTFVSSGDLGIFGNLHQMNYEIGYDIVGRSVNFLRKDCSKAQ